MPEPAIGETPLGVGASDSSLAIVLGVPLQLSDGRRAGGDGPAAERGLSQAHKLSSAGLIALAATKLLRELLLSLA